MKSYKDKIQVVYIAGNGHSGSTLLDMLLGSQAKMSSGGELNFIARKSLPDELCSCGEKTKECFFWGDILGTWHANINVDDFRKLRTVFESNKWAIVALYHYLFKTAQYKKYAAYTKLLFELIVEKSNGRTIVDSSKSPLRILILKNFADVKAIHLCRDFSGVLNSAKNSSKKDIAKGIEEDNPAKGSAKTLFDWVLTNLLCEVMKLFHPLAKLKYSLLVKNPLLLNEKEFGFDVDPQTPFSAEHMIAGNVLRLKKSIMVDPSLGFSFHRLSSAQIQTSKVISKLFWFWS